MEVIKGRMYDYNNGRFLSVDPFIQSPTSTQSMNPYTYIFNNPLSGTDPSGYVSGSRRVDGNIGYGSVCVEGMGCIGVGGGGGWQKETDNGFDMSDFQLGGSTGNVDPSKIKDESGKTIGTDFSEYVKQKTPQERWNELSWGQKLLSLFSPTVAMNASEQQAQVESWCGDGGCDRNYTEQEIADTHERARQFGEYAERVIGWTSGGELIPGLTSKTASRVMTARGATLLDEIVTGFDPHLLNKTHSISGKSSIKTVEQYAKLYRKNGFTGNPIDVAYHNGKYYILDGHHRTAAAKMTGTKVDLNVIKNIENHPSGFNNIDDVLSSANSVGFDNLRVRKR